MACRRGHFYDRPMPFASLTAQRPQIRRSTDDRLLLGVCGGLARRFGYSPVAVRTAFVLLALTGVGVAVYVLLALATDDDAGEQRPLTATRLALASAGALVALVLTLAVLRTVELTGVLLGGPGSAVLIVVLAALGALLVGGRSARAGAGEAAVESAGAGTFSWPVPQPPVLMLFTVAAAVLAGLGAWLATNGPSGETAVGVIVAAALVVVGAGSTVGAWRGRSYVLFPLGMALAAPLAVAAFADVPLTVGSDDPGVISSASGPVTTVTLGQGAGPVSVVRAAVEDGLRMLTIRKGLGRIDVRVEGSIPLNLRFAAAGGEVTVRDDANGVYETYRTVTPHTMTLPGIGDERTEALTLHVEAGFGSLLIEHTVVPDKQVQSQRSALESERNGLLVDLAGRTALLEENTRILNRLTNAYSAALARLGRNATPVSSRVLRLPESYWPDAALSDSRLHNADPALARLSRLQRLRYDLLRAAWRVHAVQRGIAHVKDRLKEVTGKIASERSAGA
jgi:phage shock protein PspC (stress-responsive transcriptional regulator)